ncbi:MAG: hypothetical protein WC967_13130 [Balneolaceae bacterium]
MKQKKELLVEDRVSIFEKDLRKNVTKFSEFTYSLVGCGGFPYTDSKVPYDITLEKAKIFHSFRKSRYDYRKKDHDFWPLQAHGKGLPANHVSVFNSSKKPISLVFVKRVRLKYNYTRLSELANIFSTENSVISNVIADFRRELELKLLDDDVTKDKKTYELIDRIADNPKFSFYTISNRYRGSTLMLAITFTWEESEQEVEERLARGESLKQFIKKIEKEDKEIKNSVRKYRESLFKQKRKEQEMKKKKANQVKKKPRSAKQAIENSMREGAIQAFELKLKKLSGKELKAEIDKLVKI